MENNKYMIGGLMQVKLRQQDMRRLISIICTAAFFVGTGYAQNRPRYEQLKPIEISALSSTTNSTNEAKGKLVMSDGTGKVVWKLLSELPSESGILPVANGGTGSSSQNWVDLTTAQIVAGAKTWIGQPTFSTSNSSYDNISILPYSSGTTPFTGTITSADLSGNVSWTFPASGGTIAVTSDANGQLAGDVSGALGANTVNKIKGADVPALTTGFLKYSGSAWTFESVTSLPSFTTSNANNILGINPGGTAVEWKPSVAVNGGDITASETGVLTVNSGAITLAKMANLSTYSKLLGSTASSYAVQELTLGTGLSLTGTTLSASGSGGTVTQVDPGSGMNFTSFTGSGTITLGTPTTLTSSTTNSLTSTSHTHAITTQLPSSTTSGIMLHSGTKTLGGFYGGTTNPSNSTRTNYDGYFYATQLFDNGIRVSTTDHTHSTYLPLAGGIMTGNLTLPAGTASLAPLKFQTGTNLSSLTFGALEFDGTNLYVTNNSTTPTRKTIAYTDSNFTGTAANASNVHITDDVASSTAVYPTWVTSSTPQYQTVWISSSKLSFVPSTGNLSTVKVTATDATFSNDISVHGISVGSKNGNNYLLGINPLASLTSGSQNIAIGEHALNNIQTGSYNIGIGEHSGVWHNSGGDGMNYATENSIYIGDATRAGASGQTNQIVIGHSANGVGSNTVSLGNSSVNMLAIGGNIIYNNASATVANLLNTTFTTVNFAGAATTLNMGVAGGATTVSGNLTVSGNFYNPSDKRLKRDIKTLSSVLDKINQIRGVNFEFIDQTKYAAGPQIGVIAQELQAVYPELVTKGEDGFLKVDYTHLTAILVQAINEQQTQIGNLQNRVDEQKKRLDTLQSQIDAILRKIDK